MSHDSLNEKLSLYISVVRIHVFMTDKDKGNPRDNNRERLLLKSNC